MIGIINNIVTTQNNRGTTIQQIQPFYSVSNAYKTDTFSFSNNNPVPYEDKIIPPTTPEKPSFFKSPVFVVGSELLGLGAIGGGLGYAIGSAFGRAGLGTAIGAGFGIVAPVAIAAYFLFTYGI